MDRRIQVLVALGVFAVVLMALIGTGVLTINIWGNETTEQSTFIATSGPFIGKVGWPAYYWIMQYSVDPYAGPYNFQWNFGDGTIEDGSNSSKHVFTSPGIYHVSVVVTGSHDYIDVLEMGDITILDQDSIAVSIAATGHCDWNDSHAGERFMNLTIWNNETFPVELSKYSFGLRNENGYLFEVKNEYIDSHRMLLGGANMTWTIFYEEGEGVPVELTYFDLYEWTVDWKEG